MCYVISYHIVLHFIMLDCTVLYCIVLYCIVLYCIVLYCIVLYCIVLYCILFYYVKLYCSLWYSDVLYCIESNVLDFVCLGLSRMNRFARPKYFFFVTHRFELDNSTVKCCIVFYSECCAYILCRAVLYGLC